MWETFLFCFNMCYNTFRDDDNEELFMEFKKVL